MSLFKRMMTWASSESHAALDSLEDPIKMAEQGIRDLRKDLAESMEGLAKVKAQVIRTRKEVNRAKQTAADYEQKAMMLLQRAQSGALDPAEADRLATEALAKRESAMEQATRQAGDLQKFEAMCGQLEANVNNLKSQVARWENELQTLKARAQVGSATRKLNEQLAKVDSTGTVAMLERMRDKVQEEETLAEAYGEMAMVERSVDQDIEKALAGSGGSGVGNGSSALLELKSRMGMGEPLALPPGGDRQGTS